MSNYKVRVGPNIKDGDSKKKEHRAEKYDPQKDLGSINGIIIGTYFEGFPVNQEVAEVCFLST